MEYTLRPGNWFRAPRGTGSDQLLDRGARLAFAALWMLGEWLRSELPGLPWLLAAHTMVRFPAAIQTAELGGSYAVGFLLLVVIAASWLTGASTTRGS